MLRNIGLAIKLPKGEYPSISIGRPMDDEFLLRALQAIERGEKLTQQTTKLLQESGLINVSSTSITEKGRALLKRRLQPQMRELDGVLAKLEETRRAWLDLKHMKPNTPEHEQLMEKIRVLSAEYQALIEPPRKG
jgi:hypothetical protein